MGSWSLKDRLFGHFSMCSEIVQRAQGALKRFESFGEARHLFFVAFARVEAIEELQRIPKLLGPDAQFVPLANGQSIEMLANLADLLEATTKNVARKVVDRFPGSFLASCGFQSRAIPGNR